MFSTTLRRRPSCADLLATIIAKPPTGLGLQERDIASHDLQISIAKTAEEAGSQLRLMIVTPSCLAEDDARRTSSRLEHLVSPTGAVDVAVVYHMSPSPGGDRRASGSESVGGLHGLVDLQKLLLKRNLASSLPVLPLTNAGELPSLIRSYITGRTRARRIPKSVNREWNSVGLLSTCTTQPPLPRDTLFIITDIFQSIQELAMAAVVCEWPFLPERSNRLQAPESLQLKAQALAALVGQEQVVNIVQFWREEWVDEGWY